MKPVDFTIENNAQWVAAAPVNQFENRVSFAFSYFGSSGWGWWGRRSGSLLIAWKCPRLLRPPLERNIPPPPPDTSPSINIMNYHVFLLMSFMLSIHSNIMHVWSIIMQLWSLFKEKTSLTLYILLSLPSQLSLSMFPRVLSRNFMVLWSHLRQIEALLVRLSHFWYIHNI